jgi:hypothetical protein
MQKHLIVDAAMFEELCTQDLVKIFMMDNVDRQEMTDDNGR